MAKRELPGDLEQLVLAAVVLQSPGAYGVTIHKQIVEWRGSVSDAAVYTCLDRLARAGYLTSRIGGATKERGGRSKRYFEITEEGHGALWRSTVVTKSMLDALGMP
jgi:PadR family transcriptional regulator PadR